MTIGRRELNSSMEAWDGLAFAGSVLIVLFYSQIWYGPATNYGKISGEHLSSIYYVPYALSLAIVITRPFPALLGLARSPFLIILLGLCIASIYWSVAPELTSRRVPALIFTTLGGVALAVRWSWTRFVEVFATSFMIMAVISLVLGLAFPDLGRMSELFPRAWRGGWIEKNSFGGMMALGALLQLAAAAMNPSRWIRWTIAAALSIGLVLLSTSKTSLLILLFGLAAVVFMLFVKGGPVRAIVGTWLAVVAVAAVSVLLVFHNELLLDALGKDGTLSGRTKIWSGILRQIPGEELTGFGLGAFWDNPDPAGPAQHVAAEAYFMPAHAHNGWLEILLAIGYPGVIVFGLWLMQMWISTIWALYASRAGWLLLPFMIAYSAIMLTESISLNRHSLWWVLFVAVAFRVVIGDPVAAPPPHRVNSLSWVHRSRSGQAMRIVQRRDHRLVRHNYW